VSAVKALALVAMAGGIAHAGSATRVVLADPDPELRRAVETSLKPWRIEVVVEPEPPPDATAANERATESSARFVVWRDGSDLVVFDHDSGAAERRTAASGAFDAVGAAAAALTVKTMMRLPPPPEEPTPVVERGLELTFQAGFGARVSGGANSEGRFQGVALVRPFLGLGLGALADVGTQASIDSAGFKGDWSDWAVLGVVSWRLPIDRYEIEPWVAGGVERSVMSGLQNQVSRTEHATLAALRGGVWARLRLGRFGIGASLDVESTQGTPTYTKPDQARAVVFEVPSFGVVAGVIIAADLAP
jgi:hypothetical protein